MISCGEAEEFVPYGREHMDHHPGDIGLPSSKCVSSNLSHITLLQEMNGVTLNSYKDWWMIRKSKDGLTEEELYCTGRTVVWSRGQMGVEGSKYIIKSMTCDSEVYQTLFTTFYTYPDLPLLVGDILPDEPVGTELPSICILERDCLSVYTERGEDYSVALPFTVRKVWSMKFGILIERQVTTAEIASSEEQEESLPVFYSLLHPLDEINPILSKTCKPGSVSKHKDTKDNQQFLASVHNEPSICVLFTGFSSTLKICRIRRAKYEENMALLQTSVMGYGGTAQSTPFNSLLSAPTAISHSNNLSSSNVHHSYSHSPNFPRSHSPTPTTTRSRAALQQTPKTLQAPPVHVGTSSRGNSPSLYSSHQLRLGITPSPSRTNQGTKTPKGINSSLLSEMGGDPEPLIPDICMELMWSGYCGAKPTSAFLTEDNIGQQFLCLLFSQSITLKCYKYELTNDQSSIVVGPEISIQARDAISLNGLKMLVIVDPSNCLLLYTGPVYVCKLHLAGLSCLNSTLFKDFSYLNISSKLNSPLGTPLRRSTLLTSGRPTSDLDLKFEGGLSPVSSEKPSLLEGSFLNDPVLPLSAAVVGVRDATDVRLTLEHISGNFYRISLPLMWSSVVVEKSLNALKYVLPKELALLLTNKWYSNRNTPGNVDFSPHSEWNLFSRTVLSLIGYDVEKLSPSCQLDIGSTSPMVASKKFRATECGSDSDWEYLMSSSYHRALGSSWSEVLHLDHLGVFQESDQISPGTINSGAPLFSQLPSILFALHLVYENFKANTLHWDLTALMIPCLTQLSADLEGTLYLDHYWRDFPHLCSLQGPSTQLSRGDASKLLYPAYFTHEPPSLYSHIYSLLKGIECKPFPFIPTVCTATKNLIMLYEVAVTNCSIQEISNPRLLRRINRSRSGQMIQETNYLSTVFHMENLDAEEIIENLSIHEKIVSLTDQLKLTRDDIKVIAPGLSLLLMNAQHLCRIYSPQNWPASAYELIERPDLVAQKCQSEAYLNSEKKDKSKFRSKGRDPYNINIEHLNEEKSVSDDFLKNREKPKEEEDGMETLDMDMLALRWPEDQRMLEVRKMLCSSKPVCINIAQRTGVSDHDFLEEQERQLYALCIRTMALPMGRGMFTLCTHSPIITEPLPIPSLNLKGKAPPRGTTIDFPINEVPPDMDTWPLFHNGVAAGLKITPNCGEITSTWIVYNKSKGDTSVSHAGFLMALGLNGHLRNFATVSLHDYLSQGHELTCVGLLLGISAAMKGTMDMQTTKVLSVHLECLLPPTSTELDVPHSVQVAAILGVGLVYADTGHRHMAEVLLQEIGRPPGPEMENSNDRESYSLAAGLGLGLIMFARGADLAKSSDLNLAGELHHYIEGGHRRPLTAVMKEKYKSPSYQIKEGDRVNINVTSPGATLALGMIYFKSGNKSIADWMVVPNTPYLLDQVRPDFLLLRTVSRGLIMWDDVMPTYKWVEGHVPTTILQHVHRGGNQSTPGVDYESIHQAYYNILAGACFVLGLKFAGSANSEAFYVLWKYTRMFANFTKRSIAELAGKSTIETCLSSILLSLSMVMAGTGDLEVLRIIRYLRARVGINLSTVGYGSHLAIHMALGFLFLGGGRFSLKTSNMSIAALIISCFPKFPTHSNDNRYHLQALRHLYVLAAEPRLFLPIDVDTGRMRMAKILLRFSDTQSYKNQQYVAKAPHMLPELSKLNEIIVEGDLDKSRFWPVRFTRGTESWHVLEALLACGNGVFLKLKEGRFPYGEAPVGTSAKLSHFVMEEKAARWTIKPSVLKEVFGCSSQFIQSLVGDGDEQTEKTSSGNNKNDDFSHTLSTSIYEYLCVGKPDALNNFVNALHGIKKVAQLNQLSGLLIWQIKLLSAVGSFLQSMGACSASSFAFDDSPSADKNESANAMDTDVSELPNHVHQICPLVSAERAMSLSNKLELVVDSWEDEVKVDIQRYLQRDRGLGFSPKCAYTLVMRDIPPATKSPDLKEEDHCLSQLSKLEKLDLPVKSVISLVRQIISKSS